MCDDEQEEELTTSDTDDVRKRINIAFWTIPMKDVTSALTSHSINYLKEHGLTVIEGDLYQENGNFQLYTYPHSTTKMTFNIEIVYDAAFLTLPALNKRLQAALDISFVANQHFDKSDEIDKKACLEFIQTVRTSNKALTTGEKELIDKSLPYSKLPFVRIPGSIRKNSSIELFRVLDPKAPPWGKATGIVDTSISNCLAWIYKAGSYERNEEHVRNNGDTLRLVTEIPDSHSLFVSLVLQMPFGVANRVFHTWFAWSKTPNYNGRRLRSLRLLLERNATARCLRHHLLSRTILEQ